MRHRRPSIARPVLVFAVASALLGGCAEIHHGVEAVGRAGGTRAGAAEAEPLPASPDVRTVRPRGAPRPSPAETGLADPSRPAVVAAVPSPRQIFDFHPAGSDPDRWRQPFVIDANDGPLAAEVRRSSTELQAYKADQKAGRGRGDDVAAAGRRCGESEVANGKPGCARAVAATPADRPAAQ